LFLYIEIPPVIPIRTNKKWSK